MNGITRRGRTLEGRTDYRAGLEAMRPDQRELYQVVQRFAISRELTEWQRAYIGRVLVKLRRPDPPTDREAVDALGRRLIG